MRTATRKTLESTLPPAPSGERKAEFDHALREAGIAVCEALHRYCDCYHYSGSVTVGERLAEMGIPDHICAAAEIVCEVADEEGIDPRLSPVEGSVHPEYLAAYRASIAKIAASRCEILLTPHPSASAMKERMTGKQALFDPNGCRAYAATLTHRLDERLAEEAGK